MMDDPRSKAITFGVGGVVGVGIIVFLLSTFWAPGPNELLALPNPDEGEIKQIATLLRSSDLDIRQRATNKLVDIGEPAIGPLMELVDGDHAEARTAAFVIAGKVNPEATLNFADRLFDSPDVKKRGEALRMLQNAPKGERRVELYIKATQDQEATIRRTAAGWLGNFKGKQVAAALKSLLKDPDRRVVEHAENALARVTGKQPGARRAR